MGHAIPVILLPGMAADPNMFKDQVAAFPNIRVQPWIPPLAHESLRDYAARIAPIVDPHCPCLIGGASLGGIVALELATRIPFHGCLLIGSIRSPADLPWKWRLIRPLGLVGPNGLRRLAKLGAVICRWIRATRWHWKFERLAAEESAFERWAICRVLSWRPDPKTRQVRVFQIHGGDDSVFPANRSQADVIVPNVEHPLSFLCPDEVNDFIGHVLRQIESPPQ